MITLDNSLYDQGKHILDYVRGCLGSQCRQTAYVTLGRPSITQDALIVWRSAGPYEAGDNKAVRLLEVDWTLTVATCCQPVKKLTPNGQVRIPNTADLETAARIHERDVATITGLVTQRMGSLFPGRGIQVRSVRVDPDSGQEGACFSDNITIAGVPWRPVVCGTC